jgi:elongation factor 1-alpha
MTGDKPTISLIWIGHVDHGKSTTLGHLLAQIGVIDQRTIEKLKEEAIQNQMESWQWAYVLDSLPEEKQRGITSDVAFYPFNTQERNFMLIDAPGHRDFVRNMIRGAAQADACVLVLSAVPNDFKSVLKKGKTNDPGGQTREHAILASVLGISQIIIAVNKMDLVNYQEEAFKLAVESIKELFNEIQSPWMKNFDLIPIIPVSGYYGENLVKNSDKMPWYSGPTLIGALNRLEGVIPKREGISRFITYDIDERHGFGTFLMGKTLGTSFRVGDTITILPQGITDEIKDIWVQDEKREEIKPGEHGSILLRNFDKDALEEGIVLASQMKTYLTPSRIKARLLLLEGTIIPGSTIVCHCGASYSTGQISKIDQILKSNPKHKNLPREFEGNITIAFPNELAQVELKLDTAIVIEKFSEFPELGRLILRHSGQTIAVGVVHELIYDK